MKKKLLLLFMVIFSTTVYAQEWLTDCYECYIERPLKNYGTCKCGEPIFFAKNDAFDYDNYHNIVAVKYYCEKCGHKHVFTNVKRQNAKSNPAKKKQNDIKNKIEEKNKELLQEVNRKNERISKSLDAVLHKCTLEECVDIKQKPNKDKKEKCVIITNKCPFGISSNYTLKVKGSDKELRSRNMVLPGESTTFIMPIDKVTQLNIYPVRTIGMDKEEYDNLLNESRKSSKGHKSTVPKENQLPKQNYNYRKEK